MFFSVKLQRIHEAAAPAWSAAAPGAPVQMSTPRTACAGTALPAPSTCACPSLPSPPTDRWCRWLPQEREDGLTEWDRFACTEYLRLAMEEDADNDAASDGAWSRLDAL